MGRDTIDGFFHHSEVPRLNLTNLTDTSVYKYTAEPTIKRLDVNDLNRIQPPQRKGSVNKFNKYYWLWKINDFIALRHLFIIAFIYPVRVKNLNNDVLNIAKKIKANPSWNVSRIFDEFKSDYKNLLAFDNVYKWSTYYRTEVQYKWNPWSASFFAMNLYTTVGYGTIAAETIPGIWLVMLYTMLFCPVTMVISRDLGQFGLVYLTKLYGYVKYRFGSTSEKKIDEDDPVILPIKFGWLAMFAFLGMTTVFLYYYDGLTGPDAGLTWWECFYFSVQTYTTAGFGDIMPINVTFDPIVGLVYFFCLPVLKVVNRMTYLYVENGIHGYFAVVESKINHFLNSSASAAYELPSPQANPSIYVKDYNAQENEWNNSLTVHSLAAMASSSADVYGGQFGRVNVRTEDLQPHRRHTSAAA
ncbi:unnamed protein product [Nippostrongylus brasiliensis]|uniref:Ion channel n=1 Tax=Nippostrongylus brasiliensis TaxID=27835 RepID=A0A0N4YDR7_NIPBR|nr:unnamed protein product [Nippostrongylus brasiliensis]